MTLDDLPFAENPALFGSERVTGLVSARETQEGVELYYRREGLMTTETARFEPFLWLTDPALVEGVAAELRLEGLEGPGVFKTLVRCPDFAALKKVSSHVARRSGVTANHPRSPQLFLNEPVHQYLLDSGRSMFNGMAFEELRRLPGIGPRRAQAILDTRAKLGGFKRIEDLMRIRGLGRAATRRLRPLVVVGPVPPRS